MIALVGCSKGGVGKTTVATHFATHLTLMGRRVCIVDATEQQHANAWSTNRLMLDSAEGRAARPRWAPGVQVRPIDCRVMEGRVRAPILRLAEDYDDLIVDADGYDSEELRSAMRAAHLIAMPFATGQFDLYAAEVMEELLAVAREYNPALVAAAFINKAETNWVRTAEAAEAMMFLRSFDPSFQVTDAMLALRTRQYFKTSQTGWSVFELGRAASSAADEIATLWDELETITKGRRHAATPDAPTQDRRPMGPGGPATRRRAPATADRQERPARPVHGRRDGGPARDGARRGHQHGAPGPAPSPGAARGDRSAARR